MKVPVSRLTLRIAVAISSCLIVAFALSSFLNSQASRGELSRKVATGSALERPAALRSERGSLAREIGFLTPLSPPLVTLTVTRTDDRNLTCVPAVDCSLREAIKAANLLVGSVTIDFSITGTITVTAAQPNITNTDVSIVGPGAASLTINQISATARIFRATAGGTFNVSDVTISGGRGGALGGGAVLCGASPSNSCSFTNVVFKNNRTTGAGTAGGAIAQGSGGNLTVSNCTFGGPNAADANQATNNTGGAIAFDQVSTAGNLSITNSTFQGNQATFNGPAGGALFLNSSVGTMTVSGNTFVGNKATAAAGQGGAVFVGNGNPSISLSRFFGNTAGGGGTGIFKSVNPGAVTATDDWWGCDDFPGAAGCDTVSGSVTSSPRIDLVLTVESGDLCPNGSKTITADVGKNTAGAAVNPTVMNGLPVTFALVSGPAGSNVLPTSATISGFMATSNFNAGSGTGSATVSATVDNGTQTASVTVNSTPTISLQPVDATVCDGNTATFTVGVSGTSTSVQWQVSTDGGANFNDISGATSTTLSFTATQSQNGNKYRAVVSNLCGTATSNAATLTVKTAPTVTTNPTNQTVCDGATATFTAASNDGSATVQWQVSTNGGGSFSNVSGATSTTLSFTASTAQNNNQYRAVFTNECGPANSTAATLTVNASTTTSDPADQTVCQGATANFSTTAGGTGPFQYAWTVDGSPSGGDSASLSVDTTSLSVGNHTVEVTTTGSCGSASQSATLTVQASTTTSDPADQTVCPGTNANFSTTAGGTGPFHYVWTVDGSPSGSDSASISVATGSLSSGPHTVSVTTTGSCGSASQSATLTVQQNTSTTDPADQSVCEGGTATFSTSASGTGPFGFVWKKGATVLNNGDLGGRVTIVSGSSSSTLVITNVQAGDFGTYNVETSGSCNTATQSATLSVSTAPPSITLNGQNIQLWPPNHSYHTITVGNLVASATSCDGTVNINSVIIDHVTSDEVENGNGDGNTTNDIKIACNRKSVQLRSERDGSGDGRVYTIYFKVTDGLGHSTTVSATVTVPKSQNGTAAVDSGPHYTVTNATCP